MTGYLWALKARGNRRIYVVAENSKRAIELATLLGPRVRGIVDEDGMENPPAFAAENIVELRQVQDADRDYNDGPILVDLSDGTFRKDELLLRTRNALKLRLAEIGDQQLERLFEDIEEALGFED